MALDTQTLLIGLSPLNDGLDVFLLLSSSLVVAPPVRSLVFTVETEVTTGFTFRLSLITLLTSKPTCEAAL